MRRSLARTRQQDGNIFIYITGGCDGESGTTCRLTLFFTQGRRSELFPGNVAGTTATGAQYITMKTDRDRIARLEERVSNMMSAVRLFQQQVILLTRLEKQRSGR